ncbi:MAG: hypothetical protein H7X93_04875 [Sphingomonadaceae bacterium]|nr:hypothetical protein [Sphingomonadaceae bacterium]
MDRAKAHIDEFDTTLTRFFAGDPSGIDLQLDPVSKRLGFLIFDRKPFPRHIACMLGDAIHNLRASLDYLISACAIANGRTPNDTHFPIVKLKDELERRLQKDVRKAGTAAINLVRQSKPYQRGNGFLYAIHQLDLADKHRLLIAVKHTLYARISLDAFPGSAFSKSFHSTRNKRRFMPCPAGLEEYVLGAEASLTSDVVFAPKLPRAGKPCVEELHIFAKAVEKVVKLFVAAL